MNSRRTIGLLLIALALGACASRIPRHRTLPEWVERINIPMFQNASYEPGLEELATRLTVEEFLADGRLRVVSRHDADLVLVVTIMSFRSSPDDFERDRFPETMEIRTTARAQLFEPSNRERPFADLGEVVVRHVYLSDPRRVRFTPDVDAKKDAMRRLSREIVLRVITGFTPEVRRGYDAMAVPPFEVEGVR